MNQTTVADARILILDDDAQIIRLLERILRGAGYTHVHAADDPRHALPLFREHQPDLLMLDLHMPYLDGLAVLRQIQPRIEAHEFLPIIFLTGDESAAAKQSALEAGASDFLTKPFDAAEVVLRIRNLLQLRRTHAELHGIVQNTKARLKRAYIEMAERLALLAEYRDSIDGSPPARVGILAAQIAEEMGLPDRDVSLLRHAAPLHDVGMIGLPQILANEGLLTLEELDALKSHTSIGAQILAGSDSPILRMAEEIALYHHENWDGTGYTPGLRGESIPLVARIVAVADTFDAMTRQKPYQAALVPADAAAWIEHQAGRKFDPEVVAAFLRVRSASDLPLLDVPA
jgi:putative two-component system response regulator